MKKVGGSAALAAMLKKRVETGAPVGDSSGSPAPAPPVEPPKPVETYHPKVTPFNPVNKCIMCDKTVYKTEEVIAVGNVWHKTCFTCGGKNSDGCNRVLKLDGYLDHDKQPYCNACFNKNFRTKGFGYGNTLNTDFGENDQTKRTVSPLRATPPFVPAAPPAPPAPKAAPPAPPAAPPAPPAPPASVAPPVPVAPPAPVAPAAPPVPTPSYLGQSLRSTSPTPRAISPTPRSTSPTPNVPLPAPKYTPTNNVTVNSTEAPKCTSCAKTVYKMEEMIAVGRIWHNSCFICGGTKGNGCGKTLKRDTYVDHENQPYCNPCYNKLFRPRGYGYGGTLSTDYGPSNAENSTEVSDVSDVTNKIHKLATTEASPDFSKPKPPTSASVVPSPPVKPSQPAVPPTQPAAPSQPAAPIAGKQVQIGGKGNGTLYKEAAYVGDNDEVDESEW